MEAIKQNIFDVLIERITLEAFEEWLYHDRKVHDLIETNSFVLDVVSIDFRSKNALYDLEKLVGDQWNHQEFLMCYVEFAAKEMYEQGNTFDVQKTIGDLASRYEFESDDQLLSQFYWLAEELDMNQTFGNYTQSELDTEVRTFGAVILQTLSGKSIENKIEILKSGKLSWPVLTREETTKEKREQSRHNFWHRIKKYFE